MIAFLLGLLAGLAIGFVAGGVFMVVQERRLQAKLRAWGLERGPRTSQSSYHGEGPPPYMRDDLIDDVTRDDEEDR